MPKIFNSTKLSNNREIVFPIYSYYKNTDNQTWWHTLEVQVTQEAKTGGLGVGSQHGQSL
jgi:hypothetical protein